MRRHDLAHLVPGATGAIPGPALDPAQQALFMEWRMRDLPLVVTRQPSDDCPGDHAANGRTVQLGLTLPQTGGRRRLVCRFPAGDLRVVRPPLSLADCQSRLRPDRAGALARLADRLAGQGITTGVYGSLSWETLSGWTYRHQDSDIDLICDLGRPEHLAEALSALADTAARLDCRLDGELRFPGDIAVAWRELHACAGRQATRVLVKAPDHVALRPLGALVRLLEHGRTYA